VKQVMPTTTDAAAGDVGGYAGHYHYPPNHETSSADNSAVSWTSAEVMSWLQRSRLQHLTDWYV